ncbi:MAG: [protein-PII] uridylyltransferase [Nitrospiraceae bacterium]
MSTSDGAADREQTQQWLADRRSEVGGRLAAGGTAVDAIASYTDAMDGLIIGRYRDAGHGDHARSDAALHQCCVVGLGGYGRRELFPHSDVDVMFVTRANAGDAAAALSSAVLHHLWDAGLQVGHSTRTIADCVELGAADQTVRTSMMDARYLAGSTDLFQEFQRRFDTKLGRYRTDWFIQAKLAERQRDTEKFGETVYLLEPNVKRSPGGLRDLHLLQWVARARYGVGTLAELVDRGLLSRHDGAALAEAREWVSRVRCFLHLHAGRAQDILSFDEQVWMAETHFGCEDRPHLRAVEQFMQQYYRHTSRMHDLSQRFVERCRSVSAWSRLTAWLPPTRVEGDIVVEQGHLAVVEGGRARLLADPNRILQLFELSQRRNLPIDPYILDLINQRMEEMAPGQFDTPEVHERFLRILNGSGATGSIAATLVSMHKVRVLEQVIPVFATVRGLMQFNQYHKYTVDEHSFLAVAKAEALADEPGLIGEVYRGIQRKDLLHLAILLHDVGKGHEEDHSEVGQRIADELARRLGMNEESRRTLVFLVHQHLLMAHTAFRRDPYDEQVLLPFVRAVGTPDTLRKLFVLTVADIAAVGPGMLTKWKESLLIELYQRAMAEVAGERTPDGDPQRLLAIVREVMSALASERAPMWDEARITQELSRFPERYLQTTPVHRMAAHVAMVERLQPDEVLVESEYDAERATCAYTVMTWNTITPGLFSKVAGVFAALGLRTLDAQILTRSDDVVLDTFHVQDPDYVGAPPPARREEVAQTIQQVLRGALTVETLLSRGGRLGDDRAVAAFGQATEVKLDHESSDRFLIVDVFADDRQGLLYVIARSLFELGLSIHAARISTRLDQVADVFYVTDVQTGGTIHDAARREQIRTTLIARVDAGRAGAGHPLHAHG